jgi:hypothetical protein
MLSDFGSDFGGVGASMSLWKKGPLEVEAAGKKLAIGQVTVVMRSARLQDPGAIRAAVNEAGPDGHIELYFVPANDEAFEQWRGSPEDYPRHKGDGASK